MKILRPKKEYNVAKIQTKMGSYDYPRHSRTKVIAILNFFRLGPGIFGNGYIYICPISKSLLTFVTSLGMSAESHCDEI